MTDRITDYLTSYFSGVWFTKNLSPTGAYFFKKRLEHKQLGEEGMSFESLGEGYKIYTLDGQYTKTEDVSCYMICPNSGLLNSMENNFIQIVSGMTFPSGYWEIQRMKDMEMPTIQQKIYVLTRTVWDD